MGLSCCKNLLLLSIFLTLLSLNMSDASADLEESKSADLIKEICPKTRNASHCFYLLGFHENATLPELGQKSAKGTVQSVFYAADVAHVHVIQAKSPGEKQIFRRCFESFAQVGQDVSAVEDLLNSGPGSYKYLPAKAATMVTDAGACDKLFRPPALPQPDDLKIVIQELQDRCSIVFVISKLLAGQKLGSLI